MITAYNIISNLILIYCLYYIFSGNLKKSLVELNNTVVPKNNKKSISLKISLFIIIMLGVSLITYNFNDSININYWQYMLLMIVFSGIMIIFAIILDKIIDKHDKKKHRNEK
jgi:undecaprenyl pyrophosphate phosphatase UppP